MIQTTAAQTRKVSLRIAALLLLIVAATATATPAAPGRGARGEEPTIPASAQSDTKRPSAREPALAASGVCAYVARAWNSGAGKSIASEEGKAKLDGRAQRIWITKQSAGCPYPMVADEAEPDGVDDPTLPMEEPTDQRDLKITRFHGRDYVVVLDDIGPYAVYAPGTGKLCDLRRTGRPTLVVDHSPLCRSLVAGQLKPNVAWTRAPADAEVNEGVTHWPARPVPLDDYFDAELEPGRKARVGRFSEAVANSCGSSAGGVVLMQGSTRTTDSSAVSLAELQGKWWPVTGGDGHIIHARGRDYILIRGGPVDERGARPRALLIHQASGFAPLCRVEQRITYTPAVARK